MLSHILTKIRKDNQKSKLYVANESNLDPGYISHVEKGERIPSQNALRKICNSLNVPFQQISYMYDKKLPQNLIDQDFINLIPYDSIIAIDSFDNLIKCPTKFGTSSFAVRVQDDSMEPKLIKGSYAFVEQNSPLVPKDIGLFFYNGEYLIRHLHFNSKSYTLLATNSNYENINVTKNDEFYIIGKILGSSEDF